MSDKDKKSEKAKGHFGGDVGYKNPPVEGQFKPGKSGNPKGRPKKEEDDLCDIIERVFFKQQRIVQTSNGVVSMNGMEVMLQKLSEQAAKGNVQAARLMLSIVEKQGYNDSKISIIPPFVPPKGVLARDFKDELPDDYDFGEE